MDELAISLENINKSFPGVKALDNVSFLLKKGEVHALVGENGAGKSTLINIIIGVLKQDSGNILINGEKQEHYSPFDAKSLGIGIVPQELNLFPNRSVAENIFFGIQKDRRVFPHINWAKIYKEAKEAISKIGLDVDVRLKVSSFTIATQQLVQITRALACGANILILDEPTASLTSQEIENLFRLIKGFKEEKKSIIFISHNLDEVKRISDRISIMRDGNLICTRDTKDISIDEIITVMAGRKVVNSKISRSRKLDNKNVLKVQNLTRKNEFNDISFTVDECEILGVAGLIGSGRTELANCIFGETLPHSGEILWFGEKVKINSTNRAINLGLGYVPEDRRHSGMFPSLSVSENMLITLYQSLVRFSGINHTLKNKIAGKFVKDLKIKTPLLSKQIKFLSGGNQQKVILARWLAKNVKLLILDEPTRGIDVNAKGEIYDLIRSLADSGVAVIVISSELEEVINLSDRIMIMHEGNLKGFLKPEEIKQEDILKVALSGD